MFIRNTRRRFGGLNGLRAWDCDLGISSWLVLEGAAVAHCIFFFIFAAVPAWAAEEPAWPQQCLELQDEVAKTSFVKRYDLAFDDHPAGYETFCVVATGEAVIVFQWSENAIQKFMGRTAIKHCRKEVWQWAEKNGAEPGRRLDLRDMQSWTNVTSNGSHSLAAFFDQVPEPSSIKAVREPDGSYRYALLDLMSDAEKDNWPVQSAAIRSPWTEAMVPAASINLMDPVRYRVSKATKVVAMEEDPSTPIPHRRYQVTGPDFEFDMTFRADDGTLLEMEGKDAAAQIRMILVDDGVNETTCPFPEPAEDGALN